MPLYPSASGEVTAFSWVPDFARGQVRDLRVGWTCEELGKPYSVRLLDATTARSDDYLVEQPFGQVPSWRDGDVSLFESGAIVLHLSQGEERLLPADPQGRARAIAWLFAALNSVEPFFFELSSIDLFNKGEAWTVERRPQVVASVTARLEKVARALGNRDWLEGRFTLGDLMMVSVLRIPSHTDLVTGHPVLGPYLRRGEARPAFQQALADQLAVFDANPRPQGASA